LGLLRWVIGGSFGLALRAAGFSGEILGVSSASAIAAGIARGAISAGATLEQAAARADLLYSLGRRSNYSDAGNAADDRETECLITDAGSTKQEIVRQSAGLPFWAVTRWRAKSSAAPRRRKRLCFAAVRMY